MNRTATISFIVLLFALVVVGLAPRRAPAQAGAPLPGMMPAGVFLPSEMGQCCDGFRMGSWVEYVMVRRGTAKRLHLHMAAVGREDEAWWIEMTMAEARRGEVTCKMLVDHGDGDRDDRLKRVILQPEGHMPLEMPLDVVESQTPPIEAGNGPGKLIGSEMLKLRAGVFETRHYRRGEGEEAHHIWLSEKVALWGLARYRSSRVTLTLLSQGTGAVSRVVGEPVLFDPSSLL